MVAGSADCTHTVRLATAECDPEMLFLLTAAMSLRYQAGDTRTCTFFPRQNLGLKGTVQRDLFGWKWYHLIDPS